MNAATAHQAAQLVSQALQRKRLVKQLLVRIRQRENALLLQIIGRGQNIQVRRMVLQVGAVHQKLAHHTRTFTDFHPKRLFNSKKTGNHMIRRANTADTRSNIGNLIETAAAHHAFEETSRLIDLHLNRLNNTFFYGYLDLTVTFNASHVLKR